MKVILTIMVLLCLTSLSTSFIMHTVHQQNSQDKCCISCELPTVKVYSLAQGRCGESCLDPKDYWKYKIFEPHMEKAESNTPCLDFGYSKYW